MFFLREVAQYHVVEHKVIVVRIDLRRTKIG